MIEEIFMNDLKSNIELLSAQYKKHIKLDVNELYKIEYENMKINKIKRTNSLKMKTIMQESEIDEVKNDLEAIAVYNAKNTFLDQYNMTKYANSLFDKGLAYLANYNFTVQKK